MKPVRIATAQFEPKSGDKFSNLETIEKLTARAREQAADVISFHELSITAYTFFQDLNREEVVALAEPVPEGPSTQKLIQLARKYDMHLLAGLVELDQDQLYNTYVCVNKSGLVAKFRKLHPFISPFFSPGQNYVVFDILGWSCGILICYDNNVIENVRATTLLGAQMIFAPHVTMCTPSSMPGRGYVDDALWQNRNNDPVPLRMEFDGPKGRAWLMRWLPARAYDNGVYYIFSNPIGYDGKHLKNGNSLILDPYGDVLTEIKSFEADIAVATLTPEKLQLAGGYRYRNARRPELFGDILGKPHSSETKPIWMR